MNKKCCFSTKTKNDQNKWAAAYYLLFLVLCMTDLYTFIIVTIYFYLTLFHVLFETLYQELVSAFNPLNERKKKSFLFLTLPFNFNFGGSKSSIQYIQYISSSEASATEATSKQPTNHSRHQCHHHQHLWHQHHHRQPEHLY